MATLNFVHEKNLLKEIVLNPKRIKKQNTSSPQQDTKLKIAIVSPFPPSKGTLNEYAFHLVEQMKNKEEIGEIVILSDQLPEGVSYPEIISDIKITIQPCWAFNAYGNAWKIRNAIKACSPDVVFYNIQFLSFGDKKIPATLGLLSPLMTRIEGTPSVVLLHNIIETVDYASAGITQNKILQTIFNWSGTLLTKLILASTMVTVTMAKYVQILEKKYKAKNVAQVPHGSFEVPEKPNFKLPKGPKKIMTFGKFGTYKKVEEMIEAVQLVRERTAEDLEIVIAGTDNPNVKGYLKNVEEQYKDIDQITFTGYVEEEDVPRIFKESTAVVFPYTSTTGSSGVLHQAGSYGKAVVLPNIGDLKELIEDEGYRGEYFMPGNVTSLADAIEKLVLDEDHRNDLAAKNYAAAASLPMNDIVDWYLMHFAHVVKK